MKPSERISQLTDETAERLADEHINRAGSEFLMKISGMNREGMVKSLRTNPSTLIACILMYLDESSK